MLGKVYSHANLERPSKTFEEDLFKSPPGPDIPAESLYAYLDSECPRKLSLS